VKAERRAGGGEAGRAEASPAQPAPISIVPDAFQRHFSHLDRPAQGGEAGLQLFVVLACQAELIDFAAGKRPLGGGADIDHLGEIAAAKLGDGARDPLDFGRVTPTTALPTSDSHSRRESVARCSRYWRTFGLAGNGLARLTSLCMAGTAGSMPADSILRRNSDGSFASSPC